MLAKEVLTEEWLADVLQDSLEMDWTASDGARAIMRALEVGLVHLPQSGGQVASLDLIAPEPTKTDRFMAAHPDADRRTAELYAAFGEAGR